MERKNEALVTVRTLLSWVLAALVLSGCRQDPGPSRPAPSAATGSIEGVVRFRGDEIPEPTTVTNATDPEVCGRTHTLEDLRVSSENRGIQNVIVSLAGVPAEAIPPLEPETIVIDNTGCRFVPHAAVTTVGSTIEAVNSDPVLHTTHLYGAREANLSLPIEGARASRTVSQPGMIVVKCDVHGWMQAFVRVDEHPFHAVTDETGAFRIEDVPAGTYTLEIWHERLGSTSLAVEIDSGETSRVDVELAPSDSPR